METIKAIQELSNDTRVLEHVLSQATLGEIVSYSALSAAIGRDVQQEARHNLDRAVRRLETNDHKVFRPVINVGMKYLNDVEIIALGTHYTRSIGRKARRGRNALMQVQNWESLPNDKKIEHNLRVAALSVISHFSSEKNIKKVGTRLTSPSPTITLKASLEAMKNDL